MHAEIDVEMNTRIDNGMYLGMDFTMDAGIITEQMPEWLHNREGNEHRDR